MALTNRAGQALGELRDSQAKDEEHVIGLSGQRIHELFRDLCREAEVDPRRYHNLRHSCGTRLYRETHDLLTVARHLGHSTTKTSELYAHLADSDYDAAVDSLDGNGVH